ncbi:Glutamate receptor ionotropic like protein [Argiope bruennichi]|uniref:Glutamate receptor ionotropic like protein n=1 Tax=Argiope bruennichi TaxID=94029 RepID=A0A8T0EWD3_ARGBR|nr:Glutamate receptor ionotropic like protein [Argiope bruennichi]
MKILRVAESKILQLAPSVEHQAEAMLSILRRYSWHSFAVITTQIGGHEDFVRAIRDLMQKTLYHEFKFTIVKIVTLKETEREAIRSEMEDLADSEARIILLFASRQEAFEIMGAARDLGLTGKHYVWIAAQSVIGTQLDTPPGHFPPGMLGVYFNTTINRLFDELERAVTVFAHGLELYFNDQRNSNTNLLPNLTCNGTGQTRWNKGDLLFKYLRNVTASVKQGPSISFNMDGSLKYVDLQILNLNNKGVWEKIGVWSDTGLDIKDIVWPGDSPVPPPGVPEKFNLKVTFLDEPPFVNVLPPDNETGECKTSRSVRCRIAPEHKLIGINHSIAIRNPNFYQCCSGFCIDLLQKFAHDLKFSYDLYRVEDGTWGVLSQNGTWNGLIAELLNQKAEIVVTSIKINSERQTAVDFTVPFLETGIAIVVAKRTGIISPKAFLEPPYGYDMKMLPPREDPFDSRKNHKFSLFRTYWLVWAILFGAAVNVDCPRGYTARFMSNVWAMFAVVFLAIYTANLAAFMITREEYYDLSGIDDKRLTNPYMTDPPFRFGTIPNGNTEAVLKRNKHRLYTWMRKFNRSSVQLGVEAVKRGELDAFIYDATVLEYLAGQDNECRLLTVGTWYAMTGYGFALQKKSKYLSMFNRAMIQYRENGDLERLQRFWLQGACKPTRNKRNVSKPLDVNQFMSAFLLLGCGSMGKSLSFRGAVYEATDLIKHHRCKDPVCDTQLWKTRHELDMANMKIRQLEASIQAALMSPTLRESWSPDYAKPRDLTQNLINHCVPYRLEVALAYGPISLLGNMAFPMLLLGSKRPWIHPKYTFGYVDTGNVVSWIQGVPELNLN